MVNEAQSSVAECVRLIAWGSSTRPAWGQEGEWGLALLPWGLGPTPLGKPRPIADMSSGLCLVMSVVAWVLGGVVGGRANQFPDANSIPFPVGHKLLSALAFPRAVYGVDSGLGLAWGMFFLHSGQKENETG
jgi:hypothetical protein